jgi:hypothetical protein
MRERIPTLLLEANGFGWPAVAKDTLLSGLLGLPPDYALPPLLARSRLLDKVFTIRDRYANLAYVRDWREAFLASPRLAARTVNVNDLVAYRRARRAIAETPLVVVLHSAAGDSMEILNRTSRWFARRKGTLAVFLGNEYALMPEKIRFLRESGADFVCSQLPLAAARWLYQGVPARVVAAPHALNPDVYRTERPPEERPFDVGFVGSLYPLWVGDQERNDLIRRFDGGGASLGVSTRIRYGNVPRAEWAEALNSFRGIPGGEAGTYYLERTDETIRKMRAFLAGRPDASFGEVFDRFLRDRPRTVSGKAISSRHFDPLGTRTCQILVEGEYNGILRAGEHYLPVKKDLSDLEDAVRRFRDRGEREAVAQRAWQLGTEEHTYARRVAGILESIGC